MPGREPLSCGDIYGFGLGRASAFQYGINTAKTALPGILNGVTLGGLIADICGNAETARIFYNNVLGERHVVRDRNGQVVNHHSIKAMIEGLHLSATENFSPLMDAYKIPQIGTTTAGLDLRDTSMYPHYTRVISANDRKAAAIVAFLARNGWSMVQAVYSEGASTLMELMEQVKTIGSIVKGCVSAKYEMGTDGTAMQILEKVRQNSMAKVLLVFLNERDTSALLEALKSASWQRDFMLVFANTYEDRLYLGYGSIMQGSFMVRPQAYTQPQFTTWLQSRQPRSSSDIPWFEEWYQYSHQCYLDASNKGTYTTECLNTPITSGAWYENAWFNGYTINAVYTAAKALDETLKYYCGVGYSGVCVKYRAATDSHEIMLQYLRNATINVVSATPFEMMNGEGLTGFDIFTYRQGVGLVQVNVLHTKLVCKNMKGNFCNYEMVV